MGRSDRARQRRFDGAAVLTGFVPAAGIDPAEQSFALRINGELRQSAHTRDMAFSVAQLPHVRRIGDADPMDVLRTAVSSLDFYDKDGHGTDRECREGKLRYEQGIHTEGLIDKLIAAVAPATATGIATGMNSYLAGIPDSLWGLFGTGYLGYTAARQWGKVKGVDK